jgi:LysM repeat protein
MKRTIFPVILAVVLSFGFLAAFSTPVQSGNVSAGDLIALVNSIRTANGLPALIEDGTLDGTAQWTAQYMADNNLSNHIGNVAGRVAAAGFGGGGTVFATENWARFNPGTIDQIAAVWSDSAHMIPMTDPNYTHIGAGVAQGSTGIVYIVHAAYRAGASGGTGTTTGTTGTKAPVISQVMEPVITSTSYPDGAVVHIVGPGQTLWSIAVAYGVHINEIQQMNGLVGSTTIYNGMKLIIKNAPTPTITPSSTSTSVRPTRTATSRLPTKTATPYYTPTATATPTPEPLIKGLPKLDRRTLGVGIIALCALGLGAVLLVNFRKKS